MPAALAFVLGLLVTEATMDKEGRRAGGTTPIALPRGAERQPRGGGAAVREPLVGPDQEYFADGVTDAIRGKLASIPGMQVIARSSS